MIARSDVVGSLLRPPDLIDARERLARNEISQAAFKRIEDAAVDDAVRLQEAAGLAVLTDGEMRRLSFQSQLTESVDGFSEWDIDAFLWGRGGATSWVTWRSSVRRSPWSTRSAASGSCPRRSSRTHGVEPTAS